MTSASAAHPWTGSGFAFAWLGGIGFDRTGSCDPIWMIGILAAPRGGRGPGTALCSGDHGDAT